MHDRSAQRWTSGDASGDDGENYNVKGWPPLAPGREKRRREGSEEARAGRASRQTSSINVSSCGKTLVTTIIV